MKNAVLCYVAPCRSCVKPHFGGTYRLHLQGRKIRERVTSVSRWLQPPRGIRHKLSSPAQVCDRGFESHSRHECLCLCFPVCRRRPCDGPIPRQRSPNDCVRHQETEKAAKVQQTAAEPRIFIKEQSLLCSRIISSYCQLINIWIRISIIEFELIYKELKYFL
jgi:hypothetical protein